MQKYPRIIRTPTNKHSRPIALSDRRAVVTAGAGLVAVALGEAARGLVLEVGLAGGGGRTTPRDADRRGNDDGEQGEPGDRQHARRHRQTTGVDPPRRSHRYIRPHTAVSVFPTTKYEQLL